LKLKSVFFLLVLTALFSCAAKDEKGVLTIAVAANMQFAMEKIVDGFGQRHDLKVRLATNSSGMLTSQIKNGAPFDVFLSANLKYPRELYKDGLSTSPVIYAKGKIALTFKGDFADSTSWKEILLSEHTRRIGIANPKTAPYGAAAISMLKSQGIFERIESKLVFGESIGQINQYIKSGTVDAAFTSNSFEVKFADSYQFYRPELMGYAPISQGAVVVNGESKIRKEASELFIKYLSTDECKAILVKYGYEVDE